MHYIINEIITQNKSKRLYQNCFLKCWQRFSPFHLTIPSLYTESPTIPLPSPYHPLTSITTLYQGMVRGRLGSSVKRRYGQGER